MKLLKFEDEIKLFDERYNPDKLSTRYDAVEAVGWLEHLKQCFPEKQMK